MENPFLENGRWLRQPSRRYPFTPPSYAGVNAHQFDPRETCRAGRPAQCQPERAKVVQIPIHFVGSEQVDRSWSATRIQKVFRGFLVRKCLKKIEDIKCEVDDIEGRLSNKEIVDLVRMDEKERLRMNESLMSLLLRLDSICGVDFGVRVCRRAVVRKVIALQENIDAIVAHDVTADDGEAESGVIVSEETDVLNGKPREGAVSGSDVETCAGVDNNKMDIVDCEVSESKAAVGTDDGGICGKSEFLVEKGKEPEDRVGGENKRNVELLESMMEENDKMMKMIAELCERNEMQRGMINALTNRVEMLEKAFVCDGKLRRRKKKKMATPAANACR